LGVPEVQRTHKLHNGDFVINALQMLQMQVELSDVVTGWQGINYSNRGANPN